MVEGSEKVRLTFRFQDRSVNIGYWPHASHTEQSLRKEISCALGLDQGAVMEIRDKEDDRILLLGAPSGTYQVTCPEKSSNTHSLANHTASTVSVPKTIAQQQHPLVVFSYSHHNQEALEMLRESLNEAGIMTTDGMQVQAGMDWRRYYFHKLTKAVVFLPLLSQHFVFSNGVSSSLRRLTPFSVRGRDYLRQGQRQNHNSHFGRPRGLCVSDE